MHRRPHHLPIQRDQTPPLDTTDVLPLDPMHQPTPTPRTEIPIHLPPTLRDPGIDFDGLHPGRLVIADGGFDGERGKGAGDAESGGALVAALGAVADEDRCGGRGWGCEADEAALAVAFHWLVGCNGEILEGDYADWKKGLCDLDCSRGNMTKEIRTRKRKRAMIGRVNAELGPIAEMAGFLDPCVAVAMIGAGKLGCAFITKKKLCGVSDYRTN